MNTPKVVDRSIFQAELDALRIREKAHTKEATQLRPPAAGSPWSRSMVRHRSLANAGR